MGVWVTELVRGVAKVLTHFFRFAHLPAWFYSLQGELDLWRIWKLLIREFICIIKESPPAPSSNLTMFPLVQEMRNTCFKVFCLMTCHSLFSSATIKQMPSVSQLGCRGDETVPPGTSPIKIMTVKLVSLNLLKALLCLTEPLNHFKNGYFKSAFINSHLIFNLPLVLPCSQNISRGWGPMGPFLGGRGIIR